MNLHKNEIKLYNMLFPIWLWLYMAPPLWLLIVLPGNFLIDSLVLVISMAALKIERKRYFYLRHIFKIFCFGLLSDIIGSAFVLLCGLFGGFRGDELLLTIPGFVLSAVLIFVLNHFVTFRAIEKPRRVRLSLIFAAATAPYTFLIPLSPIS